MIYFIIYILSVSSICYTQYDPYNWYNHPELEWHTIETEHFIITYHTETERSARETATIAEFIYPFVTSLYDYYPKEKTDIIITDYDDTSNGAAHYYDNKIVVSGRPLGFYYLRGSHRWLQNVITHEFTHIIQVGASLKYSRHLPGTYFQLMSYAEERREDVIYGFPNQIISYPVPNAANPLWFVEGTAQYMYDEAFFDYWDSTRDMILRDEVVNDKVMSFDAMNTFGKKGFGNECVYNHGFSLVKYIVKNYGEDKLKDITKHLSKPFGYSIDRAIVSTLGITGYELYDKWVEDLENIYNEQLMSVNDLNNYELIEQKGTANIHPKWSPSGDKLAFLSDKDNDYFHKSDLYIYDFADSTSKKIKSGVTGPYTWINDSLIVYTKKSKPNDHGSRFYNLYSYEILEKEETQLTEDMRLTSPEYNSITRQIAAINTFDGTSNIVIGNADFTEYEQITNYENGIQIYSLTFKENLIIYDAVINHERDLYYFNLETKENGFYKESLWDDRDPTYDKDIFVYSKDQYGIFNLFYEDKTSSKFITNVVGGAFMPSVSIENKIAFSLFENGRYNIAIINQIEFIDEEIGYSNNFRRSDYLMINNDYSDYYLRPTSNIIDKGVDTKSQPYKNKMTGPFFIPRISFDLDTFKPGLYFFDNEYLDKFTIIGSFSINHRKDLDIVLLFDYNEMRSSYFFNLYWVTRNITKIHPFYDDATNSQSNTIKWHIDYLYELFSADIGSRIIIKDHKFWLKYTYSKYRQYIYPTKIQTYVFNGENTEEESFKYAHDFFRGHSLSLDYKYDGRKREFMRNMLPKNGFKVYASIAYEKNNIFEGFKANDDYGGYIEDLKPHDLLRYKVDLSNYWKIKSEREYFLSFENNLKYYVLSNEDVDDFLYFYGGGLIGMKGYTFYEPTLQGTEQILISNTINMPIFMEKNYKVGWVYLNSLSIGFTHQFGKTSNGQIKVYSATYIEELLDQNTIDYLKNSYEFDGLDVYNNIPDHLEKYIIPDIYHKYDIIAPLSQECYTINDDDSVNITCKNHYNMVELRDRYKSIKETIGIEFKLLGFSFYSYPTAVTYEYHIPISDPWNNVGQQYLNILFDFI